MIRHKLSVWVLLLCFVGCALPPMRDLIKPVNGTVIVRFHKFAVDIWFWIPASVRSVVA